MSTTCYLIPVYNNQDGLDTSLRSILAERSAADVVIVDDGSQVPIVLRPEFADAATRKITILRVAGNGGITQALNIGLDYILSKNYSYVARLDAADTVAPGRIETQSAFLDSNPNVGLVASDVLFRDPCNGSAFIHRVPGEHERIVRALRFNNCLLHPAVTIRTDVLRMVGCYDVAMSVAEDYELFLRISKVSRVASIPAVLTTSMFAPQGISLSQRRRQLRTRLWLQWRYFHPWTVSSYLGIGRTILCLAVPTGIVIRWAPDAPWAEGKSL
jgi:glycosyltransferase involved in cell wall biosynthesis